jgi:hypothetical protein
MSCPQLTICSSIQPEAAGRINPPWIASPHQLINWWAMEKFKAENFYCIGALIESFKDTATNGLKQNVPAADYEDEINRLHKILEAIKMHCYPIGLTMSIKAIDRANASITTNTTGEDIIKALSVLDDRLTDEMEDQVFMYIPAIRAARYDQEQAFGLLVSNKFPSASFDIKESGNCFAAARYTACVFHLMRVLELGLAAFAKDFGVPSDHTNWHNIIEGIETKIRAMGKDPLKAADWKEKQEQYAQIANSFMFFKDAWRNYTAHARGKYTEDEADSIYRNVRSFMQQLTKMGIAE